jgi:hypothetical protein
MKDFLSSSLKWITRLVILVGGINIALVISIGLFGAARGSRNTGSWLEERLADYVKLMETSTVADVITVVSVAILVLWLLIKLHVIKNITNAIRLLVKSQAINNITNFLKNA